MASYAGSRPSGRFEIYAWLFMRGSGVVLLVMALAHLIIMHYGITVKELSFDVVAERWEGWFWRSYDLVLLVLALIHGMNGARIVVDDYVRSPRWRLFTKTILTAMTLILLVMGTWVLIAFDASKFVS